MEPVIETKRCPKCGVTKLRSEFHTRAGGRLQSYCKACASKATMAYHSKDRDKAAEYQRLYWQRNRDRLVSELNIRNNALKREVMDAYGGAWCHCCGETHLIFLALDHVEDDGAERRRAGEPQGKRLWRALRDQGYPAGFQVLCFNCNWAKSRGGCPHQKGLPMA